MEMFHFVEHYAGTLLFFMLSEEINAALTLINQKKHNADQLRTGDLNVKHGSSQFTEWKISK